MLLSSTAIQDMIESSVLKFLDQEYDFSRRARSLRAPGGVAADIWKGFADMGWLGLPVAEEHGGIDAGLMEAGLLMRGFGRHLVVEPYLNNVLLATRVMSRFGGEALKASWLPALVAGTRRIAFAHEEINNADPWAGRRTKARLTDETAVVNGGKTRVSGAPGAAALIVSATLDAAGATGLFLVATDSPGVMMTPCRMLEGGQACDIEFKDVEVPIRHQLDIDTGALTDLIAEALILESWEAVGAMQMALEHTSTYTGERRQFGRSLSDFQVVQHRLAEMAVCCEDALAASQLATLRAEEAPSTTLAMAAMVRSRVGRSADRVAREAVQLHGAMGVSEELMVASLFRKLLAFNRQYGSTARFTRLYGELMMDSGNWRASQVLPATTQPS